ncbi:bifunctional lysylphosphatidylglycerol flippase/synthetase MprF [Puniceicoccaceae bacterium K14]|nr:bifunctional lysylphosphatidylglycerol flippase/synthetase MprF [Puniceicoccaceae bacterium K14]
MTATSTTKSQPKKWTKWISFLAIPVFVFLLYIAFDKISNFNYKDVVQKMREIPLYASALAIVFTILSYAVMSGYDWLGQRYVGKKVSFLKTVLVSFYSYALSLNVGVSWLSGSAVRYRMYQSWGYEPGQIGKLIAFASASFWIGLAALSGVALLFSNLSLQGAYPIPDYLMKPVGLAIFVATIAYLIACYRSQGEVTLFKRKFSFPTLRSGIAQLLLAGADLLFAAIALFVLVPDPSLGFLAFLSVYCLAFFGGLLSNAPGGIGVFETVFVLFLPTQVSSSELLACLVVYRAIYFLLPLLAACVLFAVLEGKDLLGKLSGKMSTAQACLTAIAPRVLSALVFVCGSILLITGSLPAAAGHKNWIQEVFPLPVVEISHFMGSVLGLGLLFLAFAIKKRLDTAYYLTLGAVGMAVPISVLRGDGFFTFMALIIIGAVFAPCRRFFYRKSSILNLPMNQGSLLAIMLTVISTIYVGLIAFQYEGSGTSMSWWEFGFDADKPRFQRVSVAIALLSGLLAGLKLIRAPQVEIGLKHEECEDRVEKVLKGTSLAWANLALMGDKRFVFSKDDSAFIMFTIKGRTWVAMGDPVGNPDACADLVKEFKELCDEYSGIPVFYQTSKEYLHNYVDLGLRPVKVGELARVRLEDFTLEGSKRQSMRSRLKRVSKKGCSFEILDQKEALLSMGRLREISDEWLAAKKSKEKGFSLGYFDERYLSHFRFAVVRKEGEIVAFANLWETYGHSEISIDLMRYTAEAPPSTMEYLFVEIIKWAKEEGYEYFDMRIAPLSGIDAGQSAPVWNKLFDLLFNHGERFYNFRGLRTYKERFNPEWSPMYIASPGGFKLPRATAELTMAVSSRPKELNS